MAAPKPTGAPQEPASLEPPPANAELLTPEDARTRAELTAWAAEQSPACRVRAIARQGAAYFMACGDAGLWRVRRAEGGGFEVESQEQRGGSVAGFAHSEGELLVLVDLRVVQPVAGGEQIMTGSVAFLRDGPSSPKQPPSSPWVGKVSSKGGLKVIVELDRDHQLGVGYRVAFRFGDQLVIGRVARTEGSRVTVMIGLHEPAPPVGTPAVPTPSRSTSRMLAPRDGSYRFVLDLGTRLGLSRDGIFGAEGGIQARFGHLALSAELRPLVLSTLGIEVAQAFASVGFTTTWFGLSFGAGTSTVNHHDANPPGTGILFTPAVRIGTIDGLNIRSRLGTTFHRQEMHFSALFVDLQIPLSRAIALLLEGGGGNLGLGEGEAGLRILLEGNGGPKSWFLRASAGGTGVTQFIPTITALAPHLRVGVETRL